MSNLNRFLVRGDLRPNAHLALLDSRPERQYANTDAQPDLLAALASNRVPGTPLIVNYYRLATDFLISDVMAGLVLDDLDDHLIEQVRRLLFNRILYGFGAVTVLEGMPIALSPRGVWPILERGVRIGGAFVVPYSTQSTLTRNTTASGMPDRALVCEALDGNLAMAFDTEYSGITLGASFSRAGTVAGIGFAGDGASFFVAIEPIVEQMDDILRAGATIIRRHARPHIQIPAASVTYDDSGRPSTVISEQGMIFPVQSTDKDVSYITLTSDTGLIEFMAEQSLLSLAAICGVPLSVFNISQFRRLDSSAGVMALQAPAIERTLVMRSELIRAFDEVGVTIEASEEAVDTAPDNQVNTNSSNGDTTND